jgi:hypothetical protein
MSDQLRFKRIHILALDSIVMSCNNLCKSDTIKILLNLNYHSRLHSHLQLHFRWPPHLPVLLLDQSKVLRHKKYNAHPNVHIYRQSQG